MKTHTHNLKPFVVLALLCIFFSCDKQIQEEAAIVDTAVKTLEFDSVAASKYGADPYGMKKYVLAFLKKGPNRDLDSLEAGKLQTAHMENIIRMAEAGQLVLAGPFFGDGDLRGIYIFNVESIAQAEALTNTDPAIQAGSLEMELMEWYGSAALMAVNDLHKSLAREEI